MNNSANAIDNTNLLNLNNDCSKIGFVPALTYTYNAGTGAVVVTDASTLPSGDTLASLEVQLFDRFSGEIRQNISALAGTTTFDATTLNRAKWLDMKVTLTTTNGLRADGGVYMLQAAGNFSYFDIGGNDAY